MWLVRKVVRCVMLVVSTLSLCWGVMAFAVWFAVLFFGGHTVGLDSTLDIIKAQVATAMYFIVGGVSHYIRASIED